MTGLGAQVLLHIVEETARHAGHADIVRESIDGATMYALMAGAEGWPATDWLQPWEPPVSREDDSIRPELNQPELNVAVTSGVS